MRPSHPVLRAALALALAITLSSCLSQPDNANDTPPQPDPVQPSGVVRS